MLGIRTSSVVSPASHVSGRLTRRKVAAFERLVRASSTACRPEKSTAEEFIMVCSFEDMMCHFKEVRFGL